MRWASALSSSPRWGERDRERASERGRERERERDREIEREGERDDLEFGIDALSLGLECFPFRAPLPPSHLLPDPLTEWVSVREGGRECERG